MFCKVGWSQAHFHGQVVGNKGLGGGGGGVVVSVLAFDSDDPSSNPSSVKCCLKRTKIFKKSQRLVHIK